MKVEMEEDKTAETEAEETPYRLMQREEGERKREEIRTETILIRNSVHYTKGKDPVFNEIQEKKERVDWQGTPIKHCKDWKRKNQRTDHHIAFHVDLVKVEEVESYKEFNRVEHETSFCTECLKEFCAIF